MRGDASRAEAVVENRFDDIEFGKGRESHAFHVTVRSGGQGSARPTGGVDAAFPPGESRCYSRG